MCASAHGVVTGMVQYKGTIPLLVAIAHQGSMPQASSDGSVASLRQHSEMHLAQYLGRLFGMREEKGHAGCIRTAAFNALLGYSGINFSESEKAAIGHAVSTMEADGTHTPPSVCAVLAAC